MEGENQRLKFVQSPAGPRWIYAAIGIGVFALGIASRVWQVDAIIWDKYLGDALYAVMFYLCIAFAWNRSRVAALVVATLIFVVCIECFQLTGIPLQMRQSESRIATLVSIVLGTKFSWGDMLAYFVGIAAITFVDWRLRTVQRPAS